MGWRIVYAFAAVKRIGSYLHIVFFILFLFLLFLFLYKRIDISIRHLFCGVINHYVGDDVLFDVIELERKP